MVFSNIAFDQFLNLGRIDIAFFAMTNLGEKRINVEAYFVLVLGVDAFHWKESGYP